MRPFVGIDIAESGSDRTAYAALTEDGRYVPLHIPDGDWRFINYRDKVVGSCANHGVVIINFIPAEPFVLIDRIEV